MAAAAVDGGGWRQLVSAGGGGRRQWSVPSQNRTKQRRTEGGKNRANRGARQTVAVAGAPANGLSGGKWTVSGDSGSERRKKEKSGRPKKGEGVHGPGKQRGGKGLI